ncbi:MAG: hypothetical protein EXR07_12110 [Acetobacteraceae bacterium]|nr:hypothetical protein [Acetobacteraceae bacterium]
MYPAEAQESKLSPALIGACLGDIVRALSERPCVPEDQRPAHARTIQSLILSFQPQDSLQLMIAGQMVLFQTLAADGALGLLRGTAEPVTPRMLTTLTAMGRLAAKHLDTLLRLQGRLPRAVRKRSDQEVIPDPPAAPDNEALAPAEALAAPPREPRPEPMQAAPLYPGREKMLAARPSRVSGRRKTLSAHKAANALQAAMASDGLPSDSRMTT